MPAHETVNVMEVIWASQEKGEDGAVCYPLAFIDFLWDLGFVDTKKFPRETWAAAFDPFQQADGNYRITHDEFLTLGKYRYTGEIRIPFDALKINEGKYTDEGLGQLVNDSITPSCALESAELQKFVEEIKKEFRQPDDLILIKNEAKLKIKKLLDENPSPLRRLELMFDELLKTRGIEKEVETGLQKVSTTATPEQIAAIQTSAFTMGPTSLAESQASRLKRVTQAKSSETLSSEMGGEPLKKIKRSRKGLRG